MLWLARHDRVRRVLAGVRAAALGRRPAGGDVRAGRVRRVVLVVPSSAGSSITCSSAASSRRPTNELSERTSPRSASSRRSSCGCCPTRSTARRRGPAQPQVTTVSTPADDRRVQPGRAADPVAPVARPEPHPRLAAGRRARRADGRLSSRSPTSSSCARRSGPDGGGRPGCDPGCACAANEFGERHAREDLASSAASGPAKTTRWLLDGLSVGGVDGLVRARHRGGRRGRPPRAARRRRGAAVDVDVSPAYVAAARDEAARRGRADAVRRTRSATSSRSRRRSSRPTSSPSTASSAATPTWLRSSRCRPPGRAAGTASSTPATRGGSGAGPRSRTPSPRLVPIEDRASTSTAPPTSRAGPGRRPRAALRAGRRLFWQVAVYERPIA